MEDEKIRRQQFSACRSRVLENDLFWSPVVAIGKAGPPIFSRLSEQTHGGTRTDVVAICSWRALLDLFSPDRKIQAVDPNGSLERAASGRERERERQGGGWAGAAIKRDGREQSRARDSQNEKRARERISKKLRVERKCEWINNKRYQWRYSIDLGVRVSILRDFIDEW